MPVKAKSPKSDACATVRGLYKIHENIDRVAVAKIESQIRSLFDYELIVIGSALKVSAEEMFTASDRILRANLPALCGGRLRD